MNELCGGSINLGKLISNCWAAGDSLRNHIWVGARCTNRVLDVLCWISIAGTSRAARIRLFIKGHCVDEKAAYLIRCVINDEIHPELH